MKIVAIVGSPRINGNTSYLTDQALEEAEKLGIETKKIILAQYQVNPCLGHDECPQFASCRQEDDMEAIVRELYEADGIIFATPVYFGNVTAQLKAFIDRSRFYIRHNQRMKAKCGAIIVVANSAGIENTANALANFISRTSSLTADKITQVHGLAQTKGQIKSNKDAVEQAHKLGRSMVGELSKS